MCIKCRNRVSRFVWKCFVANHRREPWWNSRNQPAGWPVTLWLADKKSSLTKEEAYANDKNMKKAIECHHLRLPPTNLPLGPFRCVGKSWVVRFFVENVFPPDAMNEAAWLMNETHRQHARWEESLLAWNFLTTAQENSDSCSLSWELAGRVCSEYVLGTTSSYMLLLLIACKASGIRWPCQERMPNFTPSVSAGTPQTAALQRPWKAFRACVFLREFAALLIDGSYVGRRQSVAIVLCMPLNKHICSL